MKRELDSNSTGRERKGILKCPVPRVAAKTEQEPNERKNYNQRQARVSKLRSKGTIRKD